MARDDRESQDAAAERSPRSRTDRLSGGANEPTGSGPINPNWRTRNQSQGRSRPNSAIPTSGQDFILWLQFGGWKFLAAAVLLIIVVIMFVIITGQPSANNETSDAPLVATRPPVSLQTPLPTVTAAAITPTPAEGAAPATQGAKFRVTGTGDQGLFLRPDPSTAQAPIKTLAEGTIVTIVGDDVIKPERVWKHIKDDQGAEGYVAADFLKAVNP